VVLQFGGWAWGYKLFAIKNKLVTKEHKKRRTWTDTLVKQNKRKKMDIIFGTWNVIRTHRAVRAVAEEITKCKFDLVGVQEVRCDGGKTEQAGEYAFFYGKRE
jgi:exonuclease III